MSDEKILFCNHITGSLSQRACWSDDAIEKLGDQLSSLPCSVKIANWIISLVKSLEIVGRVAVLQRVVIDAAKQISPQFIKELELDTPSCHLSEIARGCATVLSFFLVGYQKNNEMQLLLSDAASQAVEYAERHKVCPEEVDPPYSTSDILQPHRSSVIRVAYGYAASVLYFKCLAGSGHCVIKWIPQVLPAGAVTKLVQSGREICFLRGPMVRSSASQPLALSSPAKGSLSSSNYYTKVHSGVTGLLNLGNTCFMASYLQALYFVVPFRRLLLTPHSSYPDDPSSWKNTHLLRSMATLFGCMELTKASYLKPSNVYRSLPDMFTDNRQHDSSEFGVLMLSTLEREILSVCPSSSSANPNSIANIPRHVTGEIISTTTCSRCKIKRSTTEEYVGLNLMYGDETEVTNVQCLLDATLDSTEVLRGENRYQCDSCNLKTDATKNTTVSRIPKTLILSLGRFRYDPKLGVRKKICTPTQFVETITVRNKIYQLVSIVAHSGPSSYGGHYYCVAKHSEAGWVICNDSRCDVVNGKVSNAFTRTDVPYILFYSRAEKQLDDLQEQDIYGACDAVDEYSDDDMTDDQPLELLTELPSFREQAINNPTSLTDTINVSTPSRLDLD